MSLIACPDCEKPVSDAAPTCPNCGRPIAVSNETPVVDARLHDTKKIQNYGLVIALLGIGGAVTEFVLRETKSQWGVGFASSIGLIMFIVGFCAFVYGRIRE